jgi:hypothetical protein
MSADALKAHISQCPEHPLSALVTAARSAATACGNVIYNGKQRPCEHKFHMTAWERVKERSSKLERRRMSGASYLDYYV